MKKLKILYVDGTMDPRGHPGGAVEGMRLLIKDLSKDEFDITACGTFPSLRTEIYASAGAEIVTRAPSYESLRHYTPLFKIRGGNCISKYFLARRLSSILEELKPDVLHINLLQKWDCFDLNTARRLGIKTVGHMRSLGNQSSLRPQDIAACDTVVCVSKCVEDIIKGINPDANTKFTYNGVDPGRYSTGMSAADARSALFLPVDRESYLFSVGALHPRKGHDTAIKALAEIRQSGIDAVLGIVGASRIEGDDQLQNQLMAIAEQAGVAEHVYFLGQINDMNLAYRAADIAYALSHDGEAFGRVPVEAAFSRVPVIATRVGATPEIIKEDITGFLVKPDDVADVKEKSIRLLTDEILSHDVIEKAEKFAHQNFSSAICARRVGSLYAELCSSS